ncbi:cold shock domain-containing protein [Croceicoccus sediminis]|uniref:cold shock domain-containing protein n=1 Tax=Croceicoccus sediminis TaxID=2571150 RepID=UPI00118456E6|nr:cold shock domain-containing protein [Croceicoccus sediminis]
MTNYGKIKWYNSGKGSGTILPEKGGDALPFRKSDLQQEGQEPQTDQRYSYETSEVDNGQKRAVNLRQQGESQVVEEQAHAQQG